MSSEKKEKIELISVYKIIGELLTMEKYKFCDMRFITEVVTDVAYLINRRV